MFSKQLISNLLVVKNCYHYKFNTLYFNMLKFSDLKCLVKLNISLNNATFRYLFHLRL